MFINKLVLHQHNVRDILDASGIRILVDLLTLAHLHTARAVVPSQSNIIEAGPDMEKLQEKEWYYNTDIRGDPVRNGPISFYEVFDIIYC